MKKTFKTLVTDLKNKIKPKREDNTEYEFGIGKPKSDNVEYEFGIGKKKTINEHKGQNGIEDSELTKFLGRRSNISTHEKNAPDIKPGSDAHKAFRNWTNSSTHHFHEIHKHYMNGGEMHSGTSGVLHPIIDTIDSHKTKPVQVSTGIGFSLGSRHHNNDGPGHVVVTPSPMSSSHDTGIAGEFAKKMPVDHDDKRIPATMKQLSMHHDGKLRTVLHGTAHHGIYIGEHSTKKSISRFPEEKEHLMGPTSTHIPELSSKPYHPTENPTGNWHVEHPINSKGERRTDVVPTIHIKGVHFHPLSKEHYDPKDKSKPGK
jgi:hypothetical protein